MTKASLRDISLKLRLEMTHQRVIDLSKQIEKHLMTTKTYEGAAMIFSYSPFRNEVFVDQAIVNKPYALPKIGRGGQMDFYEVRDQSTLIKHKFGMKEPQVGDIVIPGPKDIILVPGACFDTMGYRIGYGGGYYDRYLQKHPDSIKIGLTFDAFLYDVIPSEAHDQVLDFIITEKGIIRIESDL